MNVFSLTLILSLHVVFESCFQTVSFDLPATTRIGVVAHEDWLVDVAVKVARDLKAHHLVLGQPCEEEFRCTHVLDVVPFDIEGISNFAIGIRNNPMSQTKKTKRRNGLSIGRGLTAPFFVDFSLPKQSASARRLKGGSGSDLLLKAVAPNKLDGGAVVYDLTAGFGQDSLLLSMNGASKVCMVEREPIVAALLQDALRRLDISAKTDPTASDLTDRLSMKVGNGEEVIRALDSHSFPDVCYLDPMFPARKKSAAVKKNMQILHSLLGSQVQDDTSTMLEERKLLEAALAAAKARVVVKRPINAQPLGGVNYRGRKPSFEVRGSANRWDIYLN